MKLLQLFFHSLILSLFFSTIADGQDTGDFHICYFSLNNEKEFTEMEQFTKRLNKHSHCSVSVNEYMTEGDNPEESFKKMIDSGVRCDGLVISGHHTGGFGGKRSSGSLSIEFLEKLSCDEKYSKWFKNINALWLQGCRTLGTGEIVYGDSEGDADYHTTRVGQVLDEDHLEQSLADLNMEFSATLDQDNPLSSRYLRAFPAASVFGWTRIAPGEKAGSEYSVPFHMAHISRLINNQDRFPTDSPIKRTWTKESAVEYSTSMLSVLNGVHQCQELAVEAWKEHGMVRNQSTEYGFFNPDLDAYTALMNTEDEVLKQARVIDCLLKNSEGEKFLEVLDLVLKDQTLIRYTYNSLLERLKELKQTNPNLYSKMVKRLRNSKEMKTFLSEKLKKNSLGILRRIDYFAFYEEIYGKNEEIKSSILTKASEAFGKIPSNTDDEVDYKKTLLASLSKHGYLNNDQGVKLLETVLREDSSPKVRKTALRISWTIEEKAFPLIKEALKKDSSPEVRRTALQQAMSRMGEKAFPLVEEALKKDLSPEVRRAALQMVGLMGKKAVPLVEEALEDPSPEVQNTAIQMSWVMGDKALPIVEQAFKESDPGKQRSAVLAAGRIGDKALPIVEQAFKESDPDMRIAAVQAAGGMGDKALPIVEQAFKESDPDMRIAAVQAAGGMGDKALPIVEQAFKESDPDMRIAAVQAAGGMGDKALPIIEQAFRESDPNMWNTALQSVSRMGDKALPMLRQVLEDESLDNRNRQAIQNYMTFINQVNERN